MIEANHTFAPQIEGATRCQISIRGLDRFERLACLKIDQQESDSNPISIRTGNIIDQSELLVSLQIERLHVYDH